MITWSGFSHPFGSTDSGAWVAIAAQSYHLGLWESQLRSRLGCPTALLGGAVKAFVALSGLF